MARLVAGPSDQWTYELAWQKRPLEQPSSVAASGHWLLIDSAAGLGADCARRMELKGEVCQVVSADDAQQRRGAIAAFLSDPTATTRGIVYLAGSDLDRGEHGETPDFDGARQRGCGS
jgi:hypothetical protein